MLVRSVTHVQGAQHIWDVQDLLCCLLAAGPAALTRLLDCSESRETDKILKYHPNNILLEGEKKSHSQDDTHTWLF